jgi:hypothetical protein
MCLDFNNFYLTAPLDRFVYMKMPLVLFPDWIKIQYNLEKYAYNGFVYLEMRHTVWGLPQAGILANKLLRQCLLRHGYFECNNTPILWNHQTQPITFTLVVDDFGVKYVGMEHADHLIQCIKERYKLSKNWTGNLYCRIKLNWDYTTRKLDILMPSYIKMLLQKYKHHIPPTPQYCLYSPSPNGTGQKHMHQF